ncbi:Na/Pi symporter [Exiguobacterium sp. MER 193]|uniref:Na/Pi symporter n=1 Tax=Exiguobacterium sp. MER 193 TaxID=2939564 RepID=UPI002041A18A|nr:Na/Pi symporter [Exiguobacterium sp. MER 193]MCM3281637.1 Na/Pi symporter [Exiguobacterium sp. MER 193]
MEIATLVGGIGIFLLGMTLLTDTLKKWAGTRLRHRLNQFTDVSLSRAALGAMLTALFQSSSVTTRMTIGFVSAGLLTFTQSLPFVIGANVGSATTGWIIAILGYNLDVRQLFLPLIGWLTFPILFEVVNRVADWFNWNDLLRLALFHTTFHLLGVILFLPFYQTFARRLLKWIPSRSEKLTRLLDKNMSQLPTVALEAARRSLLEIERYLGNETELIVRKGRLREDELTLVDKTLSDVRVFLSTIRLEDDGKQNDYGQPLSLSCIRLTISNAGYMSCEKSNRSIHCGTRTF